HERGGPGAGEAPPDPALRVPACKDRALLLDRLLVAGRLPRAAVATRPAADRRGVAEDAQRVGHVGERADAAGRRRTVVAFAAAVELAATVRLAARVAGLGGDRAGEAADTAGLERQEGEEGEGGENQAAGHGESPSGGWLAAFAALLSGPGCLDTRFVALAEGV